MKLTQQAKQAPLEMDDKAEIEFRPTRTNTSFHHIRYLVIFLGGMTCGAMFFTRLSITVAMLNMVNHTHLHLIDHDNSTDYEEVFGTGYVEVGEFDWPNVVQQFIISGYMIAYVIPQFLTTRLSMKYGLRKSIPISLSLCGLSCLLSPVAAYWGWHYLFALRLLNGLGASAILPSMIGVVEMWMPYKDSAIGLSLLQFVQTILYTCTPLFSGYLTAIHWKWAFYVPGATAIFFCILWWLIARDDPDVCPFVSQKELDLIKGIDDGKGKVVEKRKTRTDLPWYFMFKIGSFYAFVLIWMLYCATFGGFLNLMPFYFKRVLKLTVEENGLYNFIIQVGVLGSMLWANPVIAYLQNGFNMSLTSARKIVVCFYTIVSILTWTYVSIYHNYQIVFICINRFFHMTNDTIITATLMSQFGKEGLSSTVYSMVNTLGNPGSIIFCAIVGKFLDQTKGSLACWSWVFHAMSILNVVLLLIYCVFLKSEPISMKPVEEKPRSKQ